jgi:hypothetical protein
VSRLQPTLKSTVPNPRRRRRQRPKQRPEAATLHLRTVIEGQDWRSFNREFLTGADMDFLVALGALDADGKHVNVVKMSADVRTRFSPAVLDRLVAFGVFGG